MTDFVLIEGRPYCTGRGAFEHARRMDWISPGGSVLGLENTMRKLARSYGVAVLWRADDSVTTFTAKGGRVHQRIAEPGSDEARWLIGRFQAASASGDARSGR